MAQTTPDAPAKVTTMRAAVARRFGPPEVVEIEQIPVRDVATMLDVKENTVWSRLRLARAEFERHAARARARDQERQR